MSTILVFILIAILSKKDVQDIPQVNNVGGIEIRTIELPKSKEAEKPKSQITKSKLVEKVASIKYTSTIEIKPEVKTTVAAISDIDEKRIGTENIVGPKENGIQNPDTKTEGSTGGTNTDAVKPVHDFIVNERDPEFPGGPEALKKFLTRNLNTPDELNTGEKKLVRILFKVDKDGIITGLEIINSGGSGFDEEVIRVCKRMPRWKPAIQNGINIPVSYVLPVTFIGPEQ
jgi:protein TonB